MKTNLFTCLLFFALVSTFPLLHCTPSNKVETATKAEKSTTTAVDNPPNATTINTKAQPVEEQPEEQPQQRAVKTNNKLEVELVERQLLDNQVKIKLPSTFRVMSDTEADFKYPNGNQPTLVYTNERLSVNIAFNHTTNPATAELMPQYLEAFTGQFDQSGMVREWLRQEVSEINGQTVSVLEILTKATDTDIYNLMVGIPLQERLLLVSFNCKREDMGTWKSLANEIIQSIELL